MKTVIIALILIIPMLSRAETITVFRGRPSIRIRDSAMERKREEIRAGEAVKMECVISRVGKDYYWTSRGNAPLALVEDAWGTMTFATPDGVGYIRIIKTAGKEIASQMGDTEKNFDYVEHTLMGLSGVSTYGVRRK
ncbi:MAG: hypothetical protein ABL955_02650 [Elusimicrobiota bacterium]